MQEADGKGERKVNVKTKLKPASETADNNRSLETVGYQTLACANDLPESVCKNSPRKSVYCANESKPQGEF